MIKRFLSFLLVLTMVATMLPAAVTAESAEVTASPRAGTHSAAHKCDSCDATNWTPWPTDGTIPTSGHYYLTNNVQLSGAIGLSNKKLHICLNGFVMTAKSGNRLSWTYGTAELVITDCTAYEENGVYYAGSMTGGKNPDANGGGAFYLYAGSTVEIYDGKIANCTSTKGGGAIYNKGTVNIYGGEFIGNEAPSSQNGGAIVNDTTGILYAENATFRDNHADTGKGGVLRSSGMVTFKNCTFTGNSGNTGGVISLAGASKTVLIDGCTITDNSATYVSAIQVETTGNAATIKDTQITGNTNTAGFGAVNVTGTAKPVVLQGKVVITGNTMGETTAQNLHVQNGATNGCDATGLGTDSLIGISLQQTRIDNGNLHFTTANAANNKAYFTSDAEGYAVELNGDNQLQLKVYVAPEHPHCVCGKADCTDASHAKLEFKKLTSEGDLAAGGVYYLDSDLVLTKAVGITSGAELTLCLNGHNITSSVTSGPVFWTYNEATINICDCAVQPGAIKDIHNKSTTGGTFFLRDKGVLNFYGGQILNCSDKTGGGAIRVENGATLNMYDGLISGCSSEGGGGAIFNNGITSIYGGTLADNSTASGTSAKHGGAIFNNSKGILHVENATIQNNRAEYGQGGAIQNWGSVTLQDVTVTGNVSKTGGAVYVGSASAKLTLSDKTQITGNTLTSGGAANVHLGNVGLLTVTNLSQEASIGVTAEMFRAISTETQDYTKQVFSDDSKMEVIYRDKVLYMNAGGDHKHCACAGTVANGCEHNQKLYAIWDDPSSLPTSGSWHLTVDVTVSAQTRLSGTSLELCLNGHTIRAGDRVYYITSGGKLTITDCAGDGKITGATQSAILTNGSGTDMEVNLYGGSFSGNHAAATGGAMVIQGGCTFNMYGGTITGNTVTSFQKEDKSYQTCNAGGVYVGSGAIFNMYSGEISQNEAKAADTRGGLGGGLQVAYGATANLYGGKITGNKAYNGGGIFVTGQGTVLNLKGTEVSGNRAANGGGILSQTNAVTNLLDGKITGNTATANGGGMYVSTDTTLNMSGGEFSGNRGVNGGSMYVLSADVTLSGGAISGNQAKSGAGVYVSTITSRSRPSMIYVEEGALVTENTATENGGGIVINGEGTKLIMTGGEISKNSGKFAGGVLTQAKSSFELSGGKVTGNKSVSGGGGAYISIGTKLLMTGGEISGNSVSKGHGGGAYLFRSTAEFKGGSIAGNTSVGGGGLKITGAKVTISGLSVTGNKAAGQYVVNAKTGESTLSRGFGGGLYIGSAGYTENGVRKFDLPVVNVYSIYLANNYSTGAAGGVLVESEGSVFNMYGGTVTGNVAEVDGGGAYFSTNTKATVTGGTISHNKGRNGGAIYFLNCESNVSGVKFFGNEATSSAGAFLLRGKTTKVTMQNVEVYDNHTEGASGAAVIQTYATLHLSDAKFYKNTAKLSAGAIYYSDPGYGTMTNVEIYENTAGGDAGGVYVGTNSIVTMDNVTVRDNIAGKNYGGGIHSRGRLNIKNSKILNNTVTNGSGGGIGTSRAASILLGPDIGVYAENCVISGNRADLLGGGINGFRVCPIYLTDCVITDNESGAEGGGIHAEGRMGLTNVTVTGNTSGGAGYAVYLAPTEFDGHSNQTGHKFMGGNMIIKDNENGDMYLGEGTALAVTGERLGEKSHVGLTLHSGVLSQWVFGVYDYEGSNCVYTLTAGDRSITDPEPIPAADTAAEETEMAPGSDIWLYVGIGAFVIAIAAVIVLLLKKKKKPAAVEEN